MLPWKKLGGHEGVCVVVGDLVEIVETQTTGIDNGTVGIIVKIEQITKEITIYWVNLGNYGIQSPFWDIEIRLLSGRF
mgnify:FL=1